MDDFADDTVVSDDAGEVSEDGYVYPFGDEDSAIPLDGGDPLAEPEKDEPLQNKLWRFKLHILRKLLSEAAGDTPLQEIVSAKGACVLVALPREWTGDFETGIHWLMHPERTRQDLRNNSSNARYYSTPRLINDDQETLDQIVAIVDSASKRGMVAFKIHKGIMDEVPAYLKAIFRYHLEIKPFSPETLEGVIGDLTVSEKPIGLQWPDLKFVTPDHIAMAVATAADPWKIGEILQTAGDSGEKRYRDLELDRLGGKRRSTSALPKPIHPTLRLDTLHGMDEARDWAEDLIEDLTAYKAGELPWSRVDRGALIHGQPGVGKTVFAQALAGSAGLPLVLGSVMRWQSAGTGHLGDCLQAMRSCFQQATEHAPSILFIDEIDSFVSRDGLVGNGHEYWRQVTNALLELLDGVEGREGVVVIGACNNPDKVDPAIIRSGRLDRSIEIPLPDTAALEGILRYHLGKDLADSDLVPVARLSQGATGADVERWVRGARRRARKEKRAVSVEDLRAETGPALPDYVLKNRETTAVHEIGHAILYELAWPGIVEEVRLLDRPVDGAWGWTKLRTAAPMASKEDFQKHLVCLLGGRAAELITFGEAMAGAASGMESDLGRASILAAIGEIEFDETYQHLHLACVQLEMISVHLFRNKDIREKVQEKLGSALQEAKQSLDTNRSSLQVLTNRLKETGRVCGHELALDTAFFAADFLGEIGRMETLTPAKGTLGRTSTLWRTLL